ncbi:hypothetical protein JB92DRAFT_2760613 [Gautieria morchelliformis]|nr:hypothetical protein JB92DRAFT_2760613 [Gautieria morchelliformis]
MAGLLGFLKRLRALNDPPRAVKNADALRFGILGAARIGPDALITPAKSHSEVVVAAVASRNSEKAIQYAKTHQIPKVYSGEECYQKLIEDPEIDVIYNPLPNSLHYEWTMRALKAGKHVLVEKPIADTAEEAREMISSAEQKGLVLLEAIHYTFYPAVQRVKEIINSKELGNIKSVKASFAVPTLPNGIIFLKDDVRFNYDLGGGATMDMGVYPLSAVRYFTSSDPLEVTSATSIGHALDPQRIDRSMHTFFSFPGSISAETFVDFQMPGWGPFGLLPRALKISVYIILEGGEIDFYNFAVPHLYHSIKVKPRGKKTRVEKVYKRPDGYGEEWWSTYRYQLDAFVDRVRGRTPQAWPTANEPMIQMEWVEKTYTKADMPVRPASASKVM